MTTRLILISVPPEPLRLDLERLRAELCATGSSQEAMRYPAHLTLRTGVLLPNNERDSFFSAFAEHITRIEPFAVQIGSFIAGTFPWGGGQGAGACFAGYEIVPTKELMAAHEILVAYTCFRKGIQYPYHPHLTMAFDDLKQDGLQRIKAFPSGRIESFIGKSWTCSAVECYRYSDTHWIPDMVFPLGSSV